MQYNVYLKKITTKCGMKQPPNKLIRIDKKLRKPPLSSDISCSGYHNISLIPASIFFCFFLLPIPKYVCYIKYRNKETTTICGIFWPYQKTGSFFKKNSWPLYCRSANLHFSWAFTSRWQKLQLQGMTLFPAQLSSLSEI